jgi:hypothetical protein
LDSNALHNDTAENAELARDIIALANNRDTAGYILIGVSSAHRQVKSITNSDFTEPRLRAFCKTVIFPEPIVDLTRLNIGNEATAPEHRNKSFVVIQVGPQPVGVFRFNRDLIDNNRHVHFLQNEVWIRRNSISVLAPPEAIRNLFENKVTPKTANLTSQPPLEKDSSPLNASPQSDPLESESPIMILPRKIPNYSKMPYDRVFAAVLNELNHLALKAGGKLYTDEDPLNKESSLIHQLVLPVNGNPIILRVLLIDKCTSRAQVLEYTRRYLTFEHGAFLVVVGDISKEALENCHVLMKQPWGWFFTGEFWHSGLKEKDLNLILPQKVKEQLGLIDSLGFGLANVLTEKVLHHSWNEMLTTLKQNEDIKKIVELNYLKIITALSFYLKEGCLKPAAKNYLPKTLLANEIYDPDKYGNIMLVKQPDIYEAIIKLLEKIKL